MTGPLIDEIRQPQAWRRLGLLWSAVVAGLVCVIVISSLLPPEPASVPGRAPGSAETSAELSSSGATAIGPAQALLQRCEQAMVQGICRVMNTGVRAESASRIFIAGTGEVDAALYAELRRQGDAMCGDVARHCEADWQGRACQIARSLYPVTSATPPATHPAQAGGR